MFQSGKTTFVKKVAHNDTTTTSPATAPASVSVTTVAPVTQSAPTSVTPSAVPTSKPAVVAAKQTLQQKQKVKLRFFCEKWSQPWDS